MSGETEHTAESEFIDSDWKSKARCWDTAISSGTAEDAAMMDLGARFGRLEPNRRAEGVHCYSAADSVELNGTVKGKKVESIDLTQDGEDEVIKLNSD